MNKFFPKDSPDDQVIARCPACGEPWSSGHRCDPKDIKDAIGTFVAGVLIGLGVWGAMCV